MARVVAVRKRARKRAAKRKNVVFARPQVTNSVGPKVTPLDRMLYTVAAIVEVIFSFLSIVAAIVEVIFSFLEVIFSFLSIGT
jgi:hypothetical protein